jgi:small redox-active disulfide protein 2
MIIDILGGGCKNCDTLFSSAQEAVKNLGLNAAVNKVTDQLTILSYGLTATPALVVDGQVLSYGKVLSTTEVEAFLTQNT